MLAKSQQNWQHTSELKAGLAQAFLRLLAVRRVHQALAEELDVEERVEAAHLLGFAPRAGVAELRERGDVHRGNTVRAFVSTAVAACAASR